MKNYLIIDDNEYDCHFLKECLHLLGDDIQVKDCDSIDIGVSHVIDSNPDAVFLDFSIHNKTAYDFFNLLESKQVSIPRTIIMSGVDMGKNVKALMEKGAVDYLLKDNITTKNLEIMLSKSEVSFNKISNLEFFENIVDNYTDITILCDEKENITYLNKQAQALIPTENLKKPLHEVLVKGNKKHWVIKDKGTPYQLVKSKITIKGIPFICVVLKNSSEIATLEQSLNQSDKFSKALAHDLRDQLSACDAIAQLINADPQSNDIDESLSMLEGSLKTAVTIIDSLSIITGNKKTSVEGAIDLNQIVSIIEEDLHVEIPLIDNQLSSSKVYGNSKLFITVFQNLFVNSLKHFRGNENPKVTLSSSEENDYIIVNYTDNGPGIPENVISSMCKFGVKGESSLGMGLGMYLVKSALDIMGGELEVLDSSQGAHFKIKLRKATT